MVAPTKEGRDRIDEGPEERKIRGEEYRTLGCKQMIRLQSIEELINLRLKSMRDFLKDKKGRGKQLSNSKSETSNVAQGVHPGSKRSPSGQEQQQVQQRKNSSQSQRENPRSIRTRVKTLGSILSASSDGATIRSLARRLNNHEDRIEYYLASLCDSGLLQKCGRIVPESLPRGEQIYRRTDKGSRFLEAFVAIYRAAGNNSTRSHSSTRGGFSISQSPQYLSCQFCAGHPSYPNMTPVTLHYAGQCTICHCRQRN